MRTRSKLPVGDRRLVTAVVCLVAALSADVRAQPKVKLGVEVLLDERIELVEGKRVALITNASGVDSQLVPTADRLHQDKRVKLVLLYAPEHGIRGAQPAGRHIEDERDEQTRVPVMSLFGKKKGPSEESLKEHRVDAILFDIQDIGSRTYTYTTTMGISMKAAKRAGLPFLVLDRPNPHGGQVFEGAIRQYKSFIGWGPTPVSHGMTIGELASFYNEAMNIGCDLTVVPMKGWRRDMIWDDTGLAFVPTSPGIPNALTAHLYIATGMIGGPTKNVNEGVGTTLPFQTIAAEFVDPVRFARELNAAGLPGLRFRPITYRAYYGRHKGKTLSGVQLMPTDLRQLRPLKTALTFWTTLQKLYPGQVVVREKRFRVVWGNDRILPMIRAGKSADEIEASWALDIAEFAQRRAKHLIYP